jgi:tetratricopeptide (TPR) repeat protein
MILPENRYRIGYIPQNRNRKKRFVLVIVIALILLVTIVFGIVLLRNNIETNVDPKQEENRIEKPVTITVDPEMLWEKKDYLSLIVWANSVLEEDPFREEALLYLGFASFYQGIGQFSQEEQFPYLDTSIVSLRKAWIIVKDQKLKSQIAYILGKAYYHKGRYYSDLSLRFLLESIELGYNGEDSLEYIGLAYGELGKYQESLYYFLKAAESKKSDILFLTIGQTYDKIGEDEKAESFLRNAIDITEEIELEIKCRYLLGNIYIERERFDQAINEFETILELDKRSADAHYFLGEIYDKNDNRVKARAQWRRALEIDPSHYGALTKLY